MEPEAAGTAFETLVAERMVERAVLRLGLTFAETSALVALDPDEPHAGWRRDEATGAERLLLGPAVARMDPGSLELLLRQQVLHRSMYSGFGEQYADRELADLCLEICINRLLLEGYADPWRKACAAIYARPPWAGTAALLASPAADPMALPPGLGDLWTEIWRREPDGSLGPLNPASLYFRLVRLKNNGTMGACAGSCRRPGDAPARTGAPVERVVRKVGADLGQHLPRGSSLGRALAA